MTWRERNKKNESLFTDMEHVVWHIVFEKETCVLDTQFGDFPWVKLNRPCWTQVIVCNIQNKGELSWTEKRCSVLEVLAIVPRRITTTRPGTAPETVNFCICFASYVDCPSWDSLRILEPRYNIRNPFIFAVSCLENGQCYSKMFDMPSVWRV